MIFLIHLFQHRLFSFFPIYVPFSSYSSSFAFLFCHSYRLFYCFTCHSLLVHYVICPNWRQVFLSLYCVWSGISSNSPLSLFFCHYFCTIFFGHHLSVHIFQTLLCCIVAHFSYSSHTLTGFTICIAWENMRFSSFLSSLY